METNAHEKPCRLFVVADRERNGYHDSDFYAVCIREDNGRTETRTYGSTAFGGGFRSAEAWARSPEGIAAGATMEPPPPEVLARYARAQARNRARVFVLDVKSGRYNLTETDARATRNYRPRASSRGALPLEKGRRYFAVRTTEGTYGRRVFVRDYDSNASGWVPFDALRPILSGSDIRAKARAGGRIDAEEIAARAGR